VFKHTHTQTVWFAIARSVHLVAVFSREPQTLKHTHTHAHTHTFTHALYRTRHLGEGERGREWVRGGVGRESALPLKEWTKSLL